MFLKIVTIGCTVVVFHSYKPTGNIDTLISYAGQQDRNTFIIDDDGPTKIDLLPTVMAS